MDKLNDAMSIIMEKIGGVESDVFARDIPQYDEEDAMKLIDLVKIYSRVRVIRFTDDGDGTFSTEFLNLKRSVGKELQDDILFCIDMIVKRISEDYHKANYTEEQKKWNAFGDDNGYEY